MALNVVPNAGQSLAVTRDPIRNNFGTINAAFLVDHVEYNIADQGKHKQVTFPNNAPPAAPIANEIKLYNANGGGIPQLFVQRVAAPALNIPFTQATYVSPGYTYLPSGIIIQWGQGGGPVANFPIPFPTACLTCIVSPHSNITVYNNGVTRFLVNVVASGLTAWDFVAIGY